MKVYISDVHSITTVMVKLERLDALLHFWFNNEDGSVNQRSMYIPSGEAYDSVLTLISDLKGKVLYQNERLRLDTLRRLVKDYQAVSERNGLLSEEQRQGYRDKIEKVNGRAFKFAESRLLSRKRSLDNATLLLDRWLVWMLVFAGTLITLATFYSFSFLSQRRRAENFNQTLLDTTNYGIVSFKQLHDNGLTHEFEVTYCNEAALKLLHLDDWKKLKLSDLVPDAILPDLRKAFRKVIVGKRSETIEGYLESGFGRNWVSATIAPLGDGVLVSVYNLNPIKAYEQKLTYKIKQLELANDELQQYAYVTSHDLQEPLRKIQMFSDLALNVRNEQDKSKDDYINRITASATHMRELIQTLLMFTRSTDKPTEFERVELNKIIDEVKTELEELVCEKKAIISVAHLPSVEASPVHIRLLFNNLITNALKYSRDDVQPEIKIVSQPATSVEYDRHPALDSMVNYVKIAVHDNGVGFPEAMNEKVFTIFQRLYNKENTAGNGIGLAICRKIVHQHHGIIFAEGRENLGASFYVFLPFEQPPDAE